MDLRILACADLHLGMGFAQYPELQERLTEARFAALERLVALANTEACGLLLIAGDLFDLLSLPPRVVHRAADILNGFQGGAAAVLPGNHDYFAGGSLWKGFRERAGGRILLLEEPRVYDLRPLGLEAFLYPAPCTSKHSRSHALGWLQAGGVRRGEGGLHVGVAHGAVEGISPDLQGRYYPMQPAELEAAGLDFWVVGHTHRSHPEGPVEGAGLFIPGTPEPDGFDCQHPGSAWLLEAGSGRPVKARRLDTGTFRFRQETLEPGEEPEAALASLSSPESARTLLRLSLRGLLSAEGLRRCRVEVERLRSAFAWVQTDENGLAERITPERLEAEFVRGSFSYLLLERLLRDGSHEALRQAYELVREARR